MKFFMILLGVLPLRLIKDFTGKVGILLTSYHVFNCSDISPGDISERAQYLIHKTSISQIYQNQIPPKLTNIIDSLELI